LMAWARIKEWFTFAQKQIPKVRLMQVGEPDGARRPTRIISCQRKLKSEKPECVVRKPIMASAQTWVVAN
jgi:hypothetical protein